MFKRSFVLFLVLALAVSAFVGCTSEPAPEPEQPQEQGEQPAPAEEEAKEMVLTWNLGADPKTLDPQLNSAADGGYIINNTFEGLMGEVNGKLEPKMAESYEVSEDGLTYTFKLRDAKWSDGKPVTAKDFEFSWKRALSPEVASEYSFQMFYIKGGQEYFNGEASVDDVAVKAIDDKTLEVVLNAPTPYFLDLTTFYTYMPTREDLVDNEGI